MTTYYGLTLIIFKTMLVISKITGCPNLKVYLQLELEKIENNVLPHPTYWQILMRVLT